MDAVLDDTDMQPGLRKALERAVLAGGEGGVQVLPMKGGYRLRSMRPIKAASGAPSGYRRNGPARLGVMAHLNLKLDD